jgi:glycine oxidase
MLSADVVVIGTGIIGLSIAFELVERGRSVVLVDRLTHGHGAGGAVRAIGGSRASGVAAGMLAPLCEAAELSPDALALATASARSWPSFAARVEAASGRSVDLRRDGTLLVAMDADELVVLEQGARILASHGLRYAPLSVRELRRRAPALHPRLAGGFDAPDDHQVDAQAACLALAEALTRRGALFLTGVDVESLDLSGVDPLIRAGGRPVATAPRVVVAAGAWSGALLGELLGGAVTPIKGQIVLLEGEALIEQVIRTPKVYLVPRAGGRLVVGASMEDRGFDDAPTAGVVMNLLREAWRVLPGCDEHRIVELRTGLRPMWGDGSPHLGPTADPRVWAATGHHRHGVLMAPETARRVADGVA